MKSMFKVATILLFSALMIVGCSPNNEATSTDEQPKSNVSADMPDKKEKGSIDISNLNGFVETDKSIETHYLFGGAAIKNTGETTIEIKSTQFNFEGKDGSILGTLSPAIPAMPAILKPGEIAYTGGSNPIQGLQTIDPENFDKATINIDFDSVNDDKPRSEWKFDHLQARKTQYGEIQVTGKITNKTKEKSNDIWIYTALIDKNGKVLIVLGTNVDVSLNPDATIGFTAQEYGVSPKILDKVDKIEAVAVTSNNP
ncbi:hypothetical protein IC620_16185 [Hazenella sp. IB182357]|uniref:Lipoprotein n=1 Tax=Polycladospora coralii TaxID=2771432 RepID=A0A926NHY5_9BACL|nr:hypothetical protein [Polycladospora coralii]MBD1373884.1 hypothetical protein [Polycladospora coralii]